MEAYPAGCLASPTKQAPLMKPSDCFYNKKEARDPSSLGDAGVPEDLPCVFH